MESKKIQLNNYELLESISQNSWGDVYLALDIRTKENVVIKYIEKEKLRCYPKFITVINFKTKIFFEAQNDNILKLIEYFETENRIYYVMEYCKEGNLEDYIRKNGGILKEQEAIEFFEQMLHGFQRLHEMKTIHTNIKLRNFYLKGKQIKISDQILPKYYEIIQNYGGVPYMSTPYKNTAPEVIKEERYTNLADLWSLGIVYYQMLFGKSPFELDSADVLCDIIDLTEDKSYLDFNGVEISENSKDLLNRIFECDPNDRIHWSDVFLHDLFRKKNEKGNEVSEINKKNSRFYLSLERKNRLIKTIKLQ